MTAIPTYHTGTVSVLTNGTTIVGDGTIWSGVNVAAGDRIVVDNEADVLITDVINETNIAIAPSWKAGNKAGASYVVYQCSSRRFDDVQIAEDLRKQVSALNTEGLYIVVPSTSSAPDPSLGENSQYAFQAGTGKLWVKEAGVWNFVGIFKGLRPRGDYDPAAHYEVMDFIGSNGSSYVCLSPVTGVAPPNATYYQIMAAKGDTGATGPTPVIAGTSTSTVSVGAGPKTFATQSNIAWTGSVRLRVTNAAGDKVMTGLMTAYSGGSVTINVDKFIGSGSSSGWTISLSGENGLDGTGAGTVTSVTLGGATITSSGALPGLAYDAAQSLSAAETLQARQNARLDKHGADVASAATVDLGAATGDLIDITGTTTITAITLSEGQQRTVRFTGSLVLANGASLVLPGAADITTEAGDFAVFRGYAAGVVRCVIFSAVNIGKKVVASTPSSAAIPLTSGGVSSIAYIDLTVGTWDVWGHVAYNKEAATAITALVGSIGTTPNELDIGTGGHFDERLYAPAATISSGYNPTTNMGPREFVVTAGTTRVYLNTYAAFSTATMTAWGKIRARRVR